MWLLDFIYSLIVRNHTKYCITISGGKIIKITRYNYRTHLISNAIAHMKEKLQNSIKTNAFSRIYAIIYRGNDFKKLKQILNWNNNLS